MVFQGLPWQVQWLRLCACNAGVAGSIPGWGTKIPHAVPHGQKKEWCSKLREEHMQRFRDKRKQSRIQEH